MVSSTCAQQLTSQRVCPLLHAWSITRCGCPTTLRKYLLAPRCLIPTAAFSRSPPRLHPILSRQPLDFIPSLCINTCGIVLHASYTAVYLYYASPSEIALFRRYMAVGTCAVCAAAACYAQYGMAGGRSTVGAIAAICNIVVFYSPLAAAGEVVRTRSVARMPFQVGMLHHFLCKIGRFSLSLRYRSRTLTFTLTPPSFYHGKLNSFPATHLRLPLRVCMGNLRLVHSRHTYHHPQRHRDCALHHTARAVRILCTGEGGACGSGEQRSGQCCQDRTSRKQWAIQRRSKVPRLGGSLA